MSRKQPRKTLTDLTVEKIRPPQAGRSEHWDAALPGFGLRVSASGTKTWCLMARRRGKQYRYKIGRYPQLKLADARDVARDYLTKIAKGDDPIAYRFQDRETFADLATDYVSRECPRLARGKEFEAIIKRELLPHWRDVPIREITRRDIVRTTDRLVAHGKPYAAITLHRIISRMFNWGVARSYLDASPATGLELPARAEARNRVLEDDEIRTLWTAWDEMAWPFGVFMKVLLLTGQRRNEVASMRWQDLNADMTLWTIPRGATKSDREQQVPLSPMVRDLLALAPQLDDTNVFVSGRSENRISGFSKAKARAARLSGVEGWRLHDLRRTCATGLARLGVADVTIAAVLNHSPRKVMGVTSIYNQHHYLDEKREALCIWDDKIDRMMRPKDDVVVPITRKALSS